MPTITVRLDDDTRQALQDRANTVGLTVSDFVRDLIREQVIPLGDRSHEGYSPDTLSTPDRQVLSLLHRILARVLPADADDVDGDPAYQLDRAQVLEKGFTLEYGVEFAGISAELSTRDSKRVMDILDMFRIAAYSIAALEQAGTPLPDLAAQLTYAGFDHNDPLEAKMADYVNHLIADGRWSEQSDFIHGPTWGNSHSPTLAGYLRMLAEYRRIEARRRQALHGRDRYLLSEDDLRALAAA